MTRLVYVFAALVLLCACGDDGDGGGPASGRCQSSADVALLLAGYATRAENTILASALEAQALQEAVADLPAGPTAADVLGLRERHRAAWSAYQLAAPYGYGPDGSDDVPARINPYPIDTLAVLAIGTALPATPNFDRGLAALDYLLYAEPSEAALAQRMSQDAAYVDRLATLTEHVVATHTAWLESWTNGRDDFRMRTGTAAGEGVSVLINAASRHFEDLRRDKLGTPLGVATLGVPNPQTVEARYSGTSLRYLRLGVRASDLFVLGDASTSLSLDDYLRGLDSPDARSLADELRAQYALIAAALDDVPGDEPLQDLVAAPGELQPLYAALSRQVVNLKTDLPAVSCVAITYIDNPSDSD